MNKSRFSPSIVIGMYSFFHALVISVGSIITFLWYNERLHELRIQVSRSFDQIQYTSDLNILTTQKNLILGFTELGFLILGSVLIIRYSRSKYFIKSQSLEVNRISTENLKSLIFVGLLSGFIFYTILFFSAYFTDITFLRPFNECNTSVFDSNPCSEFFPPFINSQSINNSYFLLLFLSFMQMSLLGSIYPAILWKYLSILNSNSSSNELLYPTK